MNAAYAHLLPLLQRTDHAAQMRLSDWDTTLRLARQARLLGVIAHRIAAQPELWAQIPKPVEGHLRSAINYAAYRAQMVHVELKSLEKSLPESVPVTLLKGAAYIAQGMAFSKGRIPNDVDILVDRAHLDVAEAALKDAGWQTENSDTYDERYYREWSHELPPMRLPGHAMEVDLHHTIAPVTSRTRANDALLFRALVPIPGGRFFALDPLDQIIHAAIHLFQDSELDGRLRDLVDIDSLLRYHLSTEKDWIALVDRAARHGATRVLWYALHYSRTWLGTPVPAELPIAAPGNLSRATMRWILERNCLPRLPDHPLATQTRMASKLATLRYHILRMPPGLLTQHLLHKSWKTLMRHTRRTATVG